MEGWELGLIIGCGVLAAILLAIIVRFVCKGHNRDANGENRPLLGDGKSTTTATALRFDKHIGGGGGDANNNNNDRNNNNNGAGGVDPGGFLDAQATKRINSWVDEVEKCRRGEGLAPLTVAISSMSSDSSQLLGDTPDLAGVVTPRTPTTLSPRISGVDPSEGLGGHSSTQGVYLGYSPKIVNA